MNLLAMLAIIAAAVAIGVGAMLLVRRFAKTDSFLTDTTRGSAIFGVVGTAFAVLLAFVMFVAFQSFNEARDASLEEAAAVGEQFRTARFFPDAQRDALEGELVCYARAVVHREWEAMREGEVSPAVEKWRAATEQTIRRIELRGDNQIAAYRSLLELRDLRAEHRRERLQEAEAIVSAPVWVILILGGLLTIGFVLLFTDRREAMAVQLCLMGVVAAMVSASLVLVWFLDHPYQDATGSIQPSEMERTLEDMHRERPSFEAPCTRAGDPLS